MFQMTQHKFRTIPAMHGGYHNTGEHLEFTIVYADGIKVHGMQDYDRTYYPVGRRPQTTWAKYDKAARVYVSGDAPFSVIESLMNRCRRPHDLWKPYAVDVMNRLGIEGTLSWSQKAGCSMCPCSPGFILKSNTARGWDFWITVPNLDTVDESLPARDLAGVLL